MRRRRTYAFALAALIAAGGAVAFAAAPSHATPPGRNGRIAFMRFRPQDNPLWSEIFVSNLDGSGEHRVSDPREGFVDDRPDWAPGGSRLVFERCAPDEGRCTVWTVNADGSGERRLSPACPRGTAPPSPRCPNDVNPVFSPNGRWIAFDRWSKTVNGLVIADASLHHAHLVHRFKGVNGTPDPGNETWSPGGRRLAFTIYNENSRRFKPVNRWAIFVVNVDGSGFHRITPWTKAWPGDHESNRLDWSPDGQRILFRKGGSARGGEGNLFTISPDGAGLQQLTHLPQPARVRVGSFSPDGQSIVFATTVGATDPSRGPLPDLFVMRRDGTHIRPFTRTGDWEGAADWGPAG